MSEFKILLVDASEQDFTLIQELLLKARAARYILQREPGFDKALIEMQANRHDVYLVDYKLRERNGLELIREAVERGCDSAVILLTGAGDDQVDLEAMELGASDFLVKSELSSTILERSIRYSFHQKGTMRALEESRENVSELFNSTFEGILVHELQGQILDANETAANILGISRQSLKNKTVCDVLICTENPQIDSIHQEEGSYIWEAVPLNIDSNRIYLDISSKPLHYRGRQVRLTALRDVTSKKMLEAQIILQDRLASVGLLASSLAHEIGTPLGVIRGRAEYLSYQAAENPQIIKNLDIIISQIDRVSKLIKALLNLARGEQKTIAHSVFINESIQEVLDLMAHELRKHEINMEFTSDTGRIVRAIGEAGPFQQVILNLLVNSVQAIEAAQKTGRKEGHKISIGAEVVADKVIVSIADTGCGISKTNLKNLFKPFFTTKEIGVGTGLGLTISYKFIESWGGKIQVESVENIGTTFRLILRNAPSLDDKQG